MIVMRTDASIQIGSGHVQALPDLGGGTAGAGGGGAVHLQGSAGASERSAGRPGLSGILVVGARCRWGGDYGPYRALSLAGAYRGQWIPSRRGSGMGKSCGLLIWRGALSSPRIRFRSVVFLRNQPERLLLTATGNNRPPLGQAG